MSVPSLSSSPSSSPFAALGLPDELVLVAEELGFAQPTPVQVACIPALLGGSDVLGEAQTGTGKTGAFGLPLLAAIDPAQRLVQALVLTPTRELANQVAAALKSFAQHLPGIDVLPVYGGQPMSAQLRGLHRGAQIVVGTPGRVVDHMKRGSLVLANLRMLVLDEADEMLRMGFIEDIEWILEQTPEQRQTALFSATMPAPIRRIAHRHLRSPEEIRIGAGNEAGADIDQVYCLVDPQHKLEALSRLLEVEPNLDAAMVFARTKAATLEIADGLAESGHRVAALNGDMEQNERERVVAELRSGRLNVIVATDVAARGIDVPRISHVINFDAPGDPEAYVHRIGRTGRAGRKGRAILFVEPRKRRFLRDIERLTGKPVAPYPVPDMHAVSASRQRRFAARVESLLAAGSGHDEHHSLIETLLDRCQTSERDLASALIALATELTPLRLPGDPARDPLQLPESVRNPRSERAPRTEDYRRGPKNDRARGSHDRSGGDRGSYDRSGSDRARYDRNSSDRTPGAPGTRRREHSGPAAADQVRYYLPVGREHGVGPREIVGALTHEGGLNGQDIGRIQLFDQYSHVDLPAALNAATISRLGRIHVAQRRLELTRQIPGLGSSAGVDATSPSGRTRTGSGDSPPQARKPRADSGAAQPGSGKKLAGSEFSGSGKARKDSGKTSYGKAPYGKASAAKSQPAAGASPGKPPSSGKKAWNKFTDPPRGGKNRPPAKRTERGPPRVGGTLAIRRKGTPNPS